MSIKSIEDLRAAWKQDDSEGQPRQNNYYPFWNMQYDEQAIVRFLPDKNQDNPRGFVVEKRMHTLTINGEDKSVPCLTMYDEQCPICKVSAEYYKKGDKTNGKKFWRKKQHIAQALIVDDPLPSDSETGETHEGKVRLVALGYQLYAIIKETFQSGELDEVPYFYHGGTNFIIKKTKQGDYPSYALGSQFSRRSTDLTDDEIAFVEEHLIDLSTLLPAHPGTEKVEAMLEAALTGSNYTEDEDDDSFEASIARLKGNSSEESSTSNNNATETSSNSGPSDDVDLDDEAEQIMAKLRQRQAQRQGQ